MICIRDNHLIQNIDILFELPIIILGGGHFGKRICSLLQDVSLEVSGIYDRTYAEKKHMGIQVVDWEQIKRLTQKREYILVIGTEKYEKELIEGLKKYSIKGYVCTWYGVQTAIELNINNKRFSDSVRQYFLERRDMIRDSLKYSCLMNRFYKTYKYRDAIWVWQPRKVGSTTISRSLDNANIANVHMHELMTLKDNPEYDFIWKSHVDYLQAYYNKNEQPLKIITLVRDPISRALSDFFQHFTEMVVELNVDNDIKKNAEDFIINDLQTNYQFEWFNKEIKALTGVDIYQYPFDSDSGYVWIKADKCEILILTLEQLNNNIDILKTFVANDNISLESTNIGSEKHYKYIYKQIKKSFALPSKMVEDYYLNNPYFAHFYTKEERERFLIKYKDNLI